MSTGRSELLIYMAVALATTIGLFVVHRWYSTFLDVRYHDRLNEGQPAEALLAARDEEQKALDKGKIPLPQAIEALGKRGRAAASSIAPAPSSDLSAVAGWIHRPGFKPATAHPVRTAPAPAPAKAKPAEPVPTEVVAESAPAAPPKQPARPPAKPRAPASKTPGAAAPRVAH